MVMPGTEAVSWTVLDDSGEPVGPIEGYLSHLSAIERPAHGAGLCHRLEAVVRVPGRHRRVVGRGRAGRRGPFRGVAARPGGGPWALQGDGRQPATVNQYLAAVFGFYDYQARVGVNLAED